MDETAMRVIMTTIRPPQPEWTVTTLLSPRTVPAGDRDRTTEWRGRLLHIHITPAKSLKMQELEHANLVAGRGIEGDRYFLGTGTYSVKPDVRDVTCSKSRCWRLWPATILPSKPAPSRLNRRASAQSDGARGAARPPGRETISGR